MKKTSLSAIHESLGARMVDFSGWWMPVQYTGILQEHQAVRTKVGIFDISHMGEFFVSGPEAARWLDRLLTNRVSALEPGKGQYSLMLNERGGVIDDLIVYRQGADFYFLVVNASMIEEDAAWMRAHLPTGGGVEFTNRSEEYGAVAIQGPLAPSIFNRLCGVELPAKNSLLPVSVSGTDALAAVTGYTGEAGFELFFPNAAAEAVWAAATGAGCIPCGLGARDSLRLEMAYPLNGSDLAPDRTPLEAGLGAFVDLNKGDFVGRDALLAQKQSGLPSKLCGLQMEGKTPPPRPHYPVLHNGKKISETTSGVLSPSLGFGIAMAYLPPALSAPGVQLTVGIRDRQFPARVVKKPFFKKTGLTS